ncbi:hypothetical protein EON65_45920 [archaeon]|nr:MAG: hypothetical protein EON65_45920 [archaeon]
MHMLADCWYEEILRTVLAHGGFVDANALSFLWPVEFQDYRLLFISMSSGQKALFSHFKSNPQASKEVVVLCQKEHFTLLRPCYLPPNQPFKVFTMMIYVHMISQLFYILTSCTSAIVSVLHHILIYIYIYMCVCVGY